MSRRKGKRYKEEIIRVAKEAESGLPVTMQLRKHKIVAGAYYHWRSLYSEMEVSQLKELQSENARLKLLLAENELFFDALKDVNSKKLVNPLERRRAVDYIRESRGLSVRLSCVLIGMSKNSYCYTSSWDESERLELIKQKALERKSHRLERVHEVFESAEPDQGWSTHFVHGAIWEGRKMRILTVVNDHAKHCLWIEVDSSIPADSYPES